MGSLRATSRLLATAVLIIIALLVSPALFAQVTSGSISGNVKDATGAYVPNANVTVASPEIGVNRTVTTNGQGSFVVPNLPRGTYQITVDAAGFRQLKKTDINLSIGDRLSAGDLVLEVGGSNQVVTVEADAGQIQVQADSGERSGLVTGKQLDNLAMNGRMLFDYVKVLPGVISTFNGEQSTKGGMASINVNGTRGGQMQMTVDGVTNVDNGCNCATAITINPDAVAEVKVLTSNFQAEYGKSVVQMAVTTKNGTSQFHGNGRWFHRNEGLNAANWFDDQSNAIDVQNGKAPQTPKQPYRYNYAGWQLGGPLVIPGTSLNKNKDKLYFFFSQEYYRQLLPEGYDKVYVPTVDEINGDFSKSYDGQGKKLTIVDPATGQPFPGNIIPQTDPRFNKSMQQYMLAVLPRPNATDNTQCAGSAIPGGYCNGYNFITSKTTNHPRREDIGRLDYQINPSNRLYFLVANNAGEESLPEGMSPQGISNFKIGQGMYLQEPGYSTSAHLTSNLSSSLINELTFGAAVTQQHIYSVNDQVYASKWNLTLPLVYPVSGDSPLPDVSFGGINAQTLPWTYFGSLPWNNAQTVINFSDNITKVIGKHTVKGGIYVERLRKDQSSWGNANGSFNFSSSTTMPGQTDDPYANALLGNFSSFQQQNGRLRGFYRYTNIEFFLQDNFKLTHRLTLDYGMRFSWVQPQYDSLNQVAYFDKDAWDPSKAVRLYKPTPTGGNAYDPVTGDIVSSGLIGLIVPGSGDPYNGVVTSKNGGYPGGFEDRGIMPEPRVGFAYDVLGNGKSVIRGGFGITHDRFQGNPIYNLVVGNPPASADPTFGYGNINNISAITANQVSGPTSVIGFEKSGKVPTTYSYSLGIQHDLGWGTTLDVSYVGSQSRHLSQKYNLNAIPYGALFSASAQDPSKYDGGIVTPEVTSPSIYSTYGVQYFGDKAYDQEFLEPYQGYNNIEYWNWDGDSNYNSLQVSANKRFSKGLTFGVAYTWSKTLDTSNADGDWTNIIDPKKYNYTLASWDRPHVLAVNWTYDLPKVSKHLGGSKFLSYILDGYQWEGIGQFLSGPPATINGNFMEPDWGWWNYSKMISGSYTEGPHTYVMGDPTASTGNPYGHLNPAAFVMPSTLGLPSTAWSQNYFRTGGTNRWDMSIFKNIPLGSNESRYIQLRLEAFNVFNHPQFYGINTDTGAPSWNGQYNPWDGSNGFLYNQNFTQGTVVMQDKIRPSSKYNSGNMGQYFGEYNGAGNSRIVQLGVKVYF